MEIKLHQAYCSKWDNIQYPIMKLADDSYLCITYSSNHKCYNLNIYTEEEFREQGFEEDEYCNDLFENITAEDLKYSCFSA